MADPKAPERFGQCAPSDATMRERVECAAMLLQLSGPGVLLEALRDSGLHIVSEADRKVLDACAALPEKQLQASLSGRPFRASHQQREFSQAELARRSGT